MNSSISRYLKDCYQHYISSIQKDIPEFPEKYVYPDGNPVKPVLPVQIRQNRIMIIGAFPSARFERRNGKLIPIADNLSPFGEEKYFDGREIRIQASRESLNKNYFPQLDIKPNDLWITDLVKIYLFPEKHIKNCREISSHIEFINTHKMFKKIAKASLSWIVKEIEVCNPRFPATAGPARRGKGGEKGLQAPDAELPVQGVEPLAGDRHVDRGPRQLRANGSRHEILLILQSLALARLYMAASG